MKSNCCNADIHEHNELCSQCLEPCEGIQEVCEYIEALSFEITYTDEAGTHTITHKRPYGEGFEITIVDKDK